MTRERRTLADAARAYCAEREAVTVLTRQAAALRCEQEQAAEPEVGDAGVPPCFMSIPDPRGPEWPTFGPWWEASPEQLAAMCQPCQAKVPLWRERYRQTRRLAGLMTAMRRAYRREATA